MNGRPRECARLRRLAVLAAALVAVAACGTGAGTGGGRRAPELNPVPVTSAQLRSALLTRFGHARTLPSTASGHDGAAAFRRARPHARQ